MALCQSYEIPGTGLTAANAYFVVTDVKVQKRMQDIPTPVDNSDPTGFTNGGVHEDDEVYWRAGYVAEAVITIIESGVKNEIYNICGGFEQTNLDTVDKIITLYHGKDESLKETFPYYNEDKNQFLDLSYSRQGQDVRYALNDNKLRALGWEPKAIFDEELPLIVNYYKDNFIW